MIFLKDSMGFPTMDQKISILNPDFWERQWKKAKKISTVKIDRKNYSKWLDFWNFMAEIYDDDLEETYGEVVEKIINVMRQEEFFSDKSQVFEIGAGTGFFTIPISKEVREIVALDSSKLMLQRLEEKLRKLEIPNVRIIHERWEKIVFDRKYDFIFAAFCPAMNSKESLLKMKDNSKGYACVVNLSKHDEQLKMRNELWRLLTGKDFISESYHMIYPFGILYSMGYRPQIKKIVAVQRIERDMERLIEQYERYFSIFFRLANRHKVSIRDFLINKSADGKVVFQNVSEVYILWW